MGLTRPRAYQIFDIDYKQSVRVITLSNITLSGGAPTVVDSVTLSTGDRVLVAGQSTSSQNGLYQVSVLGTGSNGTWIRSVDGNETGEIDAGMIVMVTEGDIYKDTQWKLTTNDPIIIGTTALTFEQNSAFAFGNIYANGTAVLADIVGDTVTFTPANNLIITGNATSDTVTFAVSESPTFTGNVSGSNISTAGQVTATGSVTGGNLITAGLGSFGTTVSATGNITGGNITSNARIDGGNLYLSSLTANRVVFANTDGQLINSQNFTFDGVTANIQGVLIVDNVEINDTGVSSTVGNLLLEAPAGSNVVVTGNLIPASNVYTLGSADTPWGDAFFGPESITILDESGNIGNSVIIQNITANIVIGTTGFTINEFGTSNSVFRIEALTGQIFSAANTIIENTTQSSNVASGSLQTAGGAGIAKDLYVGGNINTTGNVAATYFKGDGSLLTGIAPTVQVYEFANIASGVSTYLTAQWLADFTPGPIANITVTASTANTLIQSFITESGYPDITVLPVGTIAVTCETKKASGNKTYTCYAEIYRRTTGGTETLLATTESSQSTVNTVVQQTLPAYISVPVTFDNTDRVVTKIYARTSQGTDSITLSFDNNTNSGIQLPALPASAAQFVPYNNPTANVNLGSYGLSGTFVSATGNVTGGNLVTTGQANVGTLTVNGGSTFTGNLLPSANVTYNLGSPTQRWNEIFLAGNTIDIGGATISADLETGSLVLRGPTGAEFILTGSSPTDSFGIFGLIEAGNTEPATSTTTGAITSAGGLGVAGNIYAGGLINAIGNVTGGNLTTAGQITATGNITGGNLSATNIVGTLTTAAQTNITSVGTLTSLNVTGNVDGGNVGGIRGAFTTVAGTLETAAQPNVTSVGTLTSLDVSGNAVIGGDLTVNGNTIYVNITDLNVQDPIIGLGRGENNAPLTSDDGKDRGEQLWYYTSAEKSAFIGYDNSADKLIAALDVSVSNEIITVNSYGNFVVGGLEAATGSFTGNVDTGNIAGTTGSFTTIAGTLSTAAQPNITSVGTLTSLSVTGNVSGGNLSGTLVSGTLSTAAQPNVTSVGTLTSLSVTGNVSGGNVSGTLLTGTLETAAQPNVTSVGTLTSLSVTGNVSGGNLITAGLVNSTGNVTGGNLTTAGQVIATGNISGSTLTASGNVVVRSRQQVKFYDTDNSNFISFRAPNALTGDFILTLPTGYGNADQVLSTNGAGGLNWVDQSGGGGGSSATSYPNSTVSPVPGATGNFDLSFNFVQTSQETPFETSATDAFGVNLGEVYSMMDPGGEILEPVDLGVLT